MLRPSEYDIWRVLEGKDTQNAEKVARWLSSEDGVKWISENTWEIMRRCECEGNEIEIPTEEMLENIHMQIRMIMRRRRRRHIAMFAAAAIVPVLFMSALWMNINYKVGNVLLSDPETVCEAAIMGERKVVVFQDGSKIYLNAGSKLSYPSFWGISNRKVDLEGEGFFQVEKNPRRPFIVNLESAVIKVYGTSFNVKSYPEKDAIEVILFDGDVVFAADGNEYDLDPSEQLMYDRKTGKVDIISLKSPDDRILWTENVLMFKNNSLRDIADVLGRWYAVTFEVEDELLYSRTFTLKTDHQPLHILLDEMEYVSDLKFELAGSVVKVSLKK